MLTRCPQCHAWFRIRAEHLTVANGFVTCGRCDHVFSALTTLVDESTFTPPTPPRLAPLPRAEHVADLAPRPAQGPTPAAFGTDRYPAPALIAGRAAVEATPVAIEHDSPSAAVTDANVIALASTSFHADAPIDEAFVPVAMLVTEAPSSTSAHVTNVPSEAVDTDAVLAAVAAVPAIEETAAAIAPDETAINETAINETEIAAAGAFDEVALTPDLWVSANPLAKAPAATDALPTAHAHDDVLIATLIDDPDLSQAARAALAAAMPPAEQAVDEASADRLTPTLDPAAADAPYVVAAHTHDLRFELPDDDAEPASPDADGIPAVIYDDLVALDQPRRGLSYARAAWVVFACVLGVSAVAQIGFIERARLIAAVPASTAAIDYLCAHVRCAERQSEGAVRLLARDVREHPQYRDALLVNATIVNEGANATPFPVIDLRLRDAAGKVLSARQFQPAEYLDQSIPVADGMPSAQPVYLVLELAGNAADAVSFEFTFM